MEEVIPTRLLREIGSACINGISALVGTYMTITFKINELLQNKVPCDKMYMGEVPSKLKNRLQQHLYINTIIKKQSANTVS